MIVEQNKIAIFDLDGTLAETDAVNSAAYRAALERAGYRNMFGLVGRVTADVVRAAMGDTAAILSDDIVKAKVEAYCRELWRASPAKGISTPTILGTSIPTQRRVSCGRTIKGKSCPPSRRALR